MPHFDQRERLTRLAFYSVEHGVRRGCELQVNIGEWPADLHEIRASFVTLLKHNELRGCIGSLVASRPLVEDISHHAFAAAFEDPRFGSVAASELDALRVHISVLSTPSTVSFCSEADLLRLIQPGRDGLILRDGAHQATFLPDVWEKLPDPVRFLAQLKIKAGLGKDYWSDGISIERYTTESW